MEGKTLFFVFFFLQISVPPAPRSKETGPEKLQSGTKKGALQAPFRNGNLLINLIYSAALATLFPDPVKCLSSFFLQDLQRTGRTCLGTLEALFTDGNRFRIIEFRTDHSCKSTTDQT